MHLKSAYQRSNNIPPPTMISHPNLSLFPSAFLRLETFTVICTCLWLPPLHTEVLRWQVLVRGGDAAVQGQVTVPAISSGTVWQPRAWFSANPWGELTCAHRHCRFLQFGLPSAAARKYHNLDESPKTACTMESPISAKTVFKAYTSLSTTSHVWLTFLFHCNGTLTFDKFYKQLSQNTSASIKHNNHELCGTQCCWSIPFCISQKYL